MSWFALIDHYFVVLTYIKTVFKAEWYFFKELMFVFFFIPRFAVQLFLTKFGWDEKNSWDSNL